LTRLFFSLSLVSILQNHEENVWRLFFFSCFMQCWVTNKSCLLIMNEVGGNKKHFPT